MVEWVTATCALADCGQSFERPVRAGRPRQYHQAECRTRAKRLRAKEKADAQRAGRGRGGWGLPAAEDVHAAAGKLLEAQARQAPLGVRMAGARALQEEVGRYVAAAVHDARAGGGSWAEIGAALGIEADSARRRWAPQRVSRQLGLRSRQGVAGVAVCDQGCGPAGGFTGGAAPDGGAHRVD
ncbi:hypothetical protein VM95_00065 [Streptomyces rubellomurinus]|uniref:Uncharacterized protein n=1 Tax=Streptomyces rubellomurinus (strain ATCC 31215) TaxID=359131 RepID=A0A0F2TN50_STRR3|nr:hypothetical protein VM95_00065 [Streptomyces rubellomurinus]